MVLLNFTYLLLLMRSIGTLTIVGEAFISFYLRIELFDVFIADSIGLNYE